MPLKICPRCSCQNILAIYDRDLDCTVAWKCEGCGHDWKRDLAEVLTVADNSAFDEIEAGGCAPAILASKREPQ